MYTFALIKFILAFAIALGKNVSYLESQNFYILMFMQLCGIHFDYEIINFTLKIFNSLLQQSHFNRTKTKVQMDATI